MILEFLNLNFQPLANSYSIEPNSPKVYELKVGFDDETKLVSLLKQPPPETLFTKDYPYDSSHSPFLVKHFQNIADQIHEVYKPKKVLEIGTNSLPFLRHFDKKTSVGVEPCENFADYGRQQGYFIYKDFWTKDLAKQIVQDHGKFDFVYAANCMCHIPNIIEAFQAVDEVLIKDGIFIMEDPSLREVIRCNAWDQFYDEHFSVFSVLSLSNIVWKNTNLEVYDVQHLQIHGGSNRVFIKKKDNICHKQQSNLLRVIDDEVWCGLNRDQTYYRFAEKVKRSKEDLKEWIHFLRSSDHVIPLYGASSKATTILNYCELSSKDISYALDTIPAKHHKYIPGTDIQIRPYEIDWYKGLKYAFIGSYNFTEQIVDKEKEFKRKGGRWLSHSPYVRLL